MLKAIVAEIIQRTKFKKLKDRTTAIDEHWRKFPHSIFNSVSVFFFFYQMSTFYWKHLFAARTKLKNDLDHKTVSGHLVHNQCCLYPSDIQTALWCRIFFFVYFHSPFIFLHICFQFHFSYGFCFILDYPYNWEVVLWFMSNSRLLQSSNIWPCLKGN